MKTINYLVALFFIFALGIFTTSCMDEEEGKENTDNRTVLLRIAAPENDVISPTKAGTNLKVVDETIKNICVLIYDQQGQITDEAFYDEGTGISDIQNNVNGHTYQLAMKDSGTRTIYVVANVGDKRSAWATKDQVTDVYQLDANLLPQCVLFADGQTFSGVNKNITASLKRIYAKITVVVDTKGVTNATIIPQNVVLKNVPFSGQLTLNRISDSPKENVDYLANAGTITFAEPVNKVSGSHDGNASVFFMYENMQPQGSCTYLQDGTPNQAYKTPASIGEPTKNPNTVATNKTCSYIEVTTNYASAQKGKGTVKYRFFLGKNAYDNFEVERNYHYKVTLTLSGDGGIDEASWRVETNIMGIYVPLDTYVGYMLNSESRMYLDIDPDDKELKKATWSITHSSGTDVVNLANNQLQYDSELGKYYLIVKAKETNVSDRQQIAGVYSVNASGSQITPPKVTVTQVIRILDPIAFYHQNTSTPFSKDVVVKRFNKTPDNFYIPLPSSGAWTVSVEQGDWFTLSKHPDQAADNTVKLVNEQIKGEGGAIKFHFAAKALGTAATRYGCISVKYHNNMCEHKIYLRQGAGDTQLLSGEAKWAYSNVVGLNANGTYATQPGPMFAGGNSENMYNSYIPVYRTTYSNFTAKDRSNWGTSENTKKGPCPTGYTLPSARDMSAIKRGCHDDVLTASVGYIYDDDATSGWAWNSSKTAAVVTDMNHSNPAKGIVFVNKQTQVNLVFPFGNGVLDHNKVPANRVNTMDTGLDEIGVGFRNSYSGVTAGLYTEEDVKENGKENVYVSYNGNYWSGTPGADGGQHLCYMKFWYFLKRNVPVYVSDGSDRWGASWQVNGKGAGGLDRTNGMFVRCVKESKPTNDNYWNNRW